MRGILNQKNVRIMSKEEELELREAIANLVDDEEPQTRQIKVKQAKPDDRIAVRVLPNHEQIVAVLRELEKEDFERVIKAARQYRRADRTLNR